MAIAETDILFKLSGGAANTSPAASLGLAMSTVGGGIITKTKTFNSIFDDVSGAEAAAGDIEYRCIYVHNNHGSLTLTGAKVWIEANTGSGSSTIAIGLDLAGKNGTADDIADESTAPSPAVTFSEACTSYATGLALGDLAFSEKYAIWIRRTITAAMPANDDDNWTLKVQGDTAA
jgi:hypothetical protein